MTALDFSADTGLVAVFLATANICLGLLIAVRYSPRRLWPHRRINIFAVHTWTAYLLLTAIVAHPLILLLVRSPRWRLLDLAVPAWSPVQPLENTIGAIGGYLVAAVVVTSVLRLRLGRRVWKAFHYLVYAASICVFLHSILTDPELKGNRIDPFDGEKVFVEVCALVVVLAAGWAWRYRLQKTRRDRDLKAGRYRFPGQAHSGEESVRNPVVQFPGERTGS